jgi:hypothetical protein
MKPRSTALLISTALLVLNGIQGAIGIPAAFVAHDHGQFTRTAQISSGIGAIIGTLVWCGLAYAQWARRGTWGRGIGILAIMVLLIQSYLTWLAVRSGRVPQDASTIARFVIFTLLVFSVLAITSFVSHSNSRKTT